MSREIIKQEGKIVLVEDSGYIKPGFGGWFQSYSLAPDGTILHTNYADHLCSADEFNQPIDLKDVPVDVAKLLGISKS